MLEQEELIIDITYSQFGEQYEKVIITHDNTLYEVYETSYRHSKPYRECYEDDEHIVLLDRYYDQVMKHIQKEPTV
ncbi:hypothetical protein D3C78_1664570 [compost metagenome]